MAIIYSYPQVKPKTTDLLVGTVVYQSDEANPVDGNPTKTFSLRDVGELLSSYKLSSKALGPNATIILSDDFDHISAVNLIRGSGISISDNGSNNITLSNTGVLSVVGANTNFINSTPVFASTGEVTVSSSLSASGGASNRTYLRGDNTWSTPVLTVNTLNTSFINLSPTSSTNGDVTVSALLSASGTPGTSNYLRGDNTWSTPLNSIEATNTTYIATTLSTSETGNVSFSSALSATGDPNDQNFLRGDNVWAVPAGGGTLTSIVAGDGIGVDDTDPANPVVSNTGVLSNIAGTGISISSATGDSTITNTAPDQTVVITGSGGATVTGTYPNFNIETTDAEGVETVVAGASISVDSTDPANPIVTNTAPDQTVSITGSGSTTVTGTYPNFNIESVGNTYTAGAGLTLNGTEFSNTAPDQTVVLNEGANITITGTYPNFTITGANSPTSPVTSVNTQIGAVVLDTDDIAEGATNLYDKTVVITGTGAATVTGTYPSFNINATDTDTTYTAGSGLELTGTEFSNTAPDQTVTITGAGDTVVTGTYPDFTVTSTSDPIPTVLPSDFVFINVKNETGSTIPLGTGLMAVGTDGNSGHILVAPMVADGSVEPKYYIGVLEEELLNGGLGRAVTQGEVNQINTNAFLDSDVLWCDPANPGGFVKTEPLAPNLKISTAIVLNASTNGKIFVRVQGNEGLHELHDVGIVSQTDKQVLAWNDTTGYWQNQDNLYSLTAGTGLNGGTITTTGTISLADTAVTPGAYTNANITVDQQGRITLASNGDPGGVTSFTASNGSFITLTPNTSQTGAATLTADLSASGPATATTFLRGDNQWATVYDTTYDYSSAQSGADVNLNLTPSSGTVDTVKLVAGAGVTLTDDGSNNVTIAASSTITRNDFTGNGTATDYTLTVAPSSINFVDVYVSGAYQNKDGFTIAGTTLSFSEAPANGDAIEVMIISNVSLVQNEIVNYGVNTISTSITAVKNNLYVLTADLTLTLPASPQDGDSIKISNLSGVATCILGRNGSLIMGVASDLTLDTSSASFELIYSGATKGWVIVGL